MTLSRATVLSACVLLAAVALTSAFAAGGMGAVKPADPETAALFETDIIKAAVKQSLGVSASHVKLISYRSQVVAGLNYIAHVSINGASDVLVTAFRPLPHTGLPLEVKTVVYGTL